MAQLLPTFQAKCNARTVGMSAPFLIRPDTNQVCTGLGLRLLSPVPIVGMVPGAVYRMRPYSGESTPSRPIWEVKHQQAQLVLR